MSDGWVKLHRKMLDSQYGKNLELMGFFTCLLMMANHKEGFTQDGTKILPGQFMTSQIKLSEQFNVNRAKVQRFLKKLCDSQQIEQRSNFQNTIITIVNWHKYQDGEQRPSSARAASEQRVSTNKNNKNNKNEKKNTEDASVHKTMLQLDDMINSWNLASQKSHLKPCPLVPTQKILLLAGKAKEVLDGAGYTWAEYFEKITNSEFLKSKKGSPITLLWALDEENFNKIIFGNFDDKTDPLAEFFNKNGIKGI